MSRIGGAIKNMIKGWLDLNEAQNTQFNITELYNFDTNTIRNRIWYRGDPYELSQFYKQVEDNNSTFWSVVPEIKIRKIHSGLPALMINTLSGIVIRDLNGITPNSSSIDWDNISNDNNFYDVIEQAVIDTLSQGDGAFKISFDTSISEYPIIEFYPADQCEFVYKRGRYIETVFKNIYEANQKKYIHYETYGYGYIKNKLVEARSGKEVDLYSIAQMENVADFAFSGYKEKDGEVISRGTVNLAVPFKIYRSAKWVHRGKSIFENKYDIFDALDEVISQWAAAVRAGRATKYIPESMLPRDPVSGKILPANDFDNCYIATGDTGKEEAKDKIEVVQPDIPVESYIQSYTTFLDQCLQGLISPSTLGIDTKKLDNAEAQREKEKTTLYTRGKIVETLEKVIPDVVNTALKAMDIFNKKAPRESEDVEVSFGEYANPSFEAVVETVSKARPGQPVMSIEAAVEEMYGDSRDEKWKVEEIKRLKEQQGIADDIEEPGMNVPDVDDLEEDIDDSVN